MQHSLADLRDLTNEQSAVIACLENKPDFTENFYFTGGTCLKALGIVPRLSNDLDFFTDASVNPLHFSSLVSQLHKYLIETFSEENIRNTERGFLHISSGMLIDCILDTQPPIGEFGYYGALRTASLEDIAAHKASALCSRDEVKDMIDIAYITKAKGWTLADLEHLAEKKFRIGTISEEKLLTELLHKRKNLEVPSEIFLHDPDENSVFVQKQIDHLLANVTL